jgi:hypothetical protein
MPFYSLFYLFHLPSAFVFLGSGGTAFSGSKKSINLFDRFLSYPVGHTNNRTVLRYAVEFQNVDRQNVDV